MKRISVLVLMIGTLILALSLSLGILSPPFLTGLLTSRAQSSWDSKFWVFDGHMHPISSVYRRGGTIGETNADPRFTLPLAQQGGLGASQTKRYTQCLDTQINQAKYNQGTWVQKRKYELTKLEEQSGNTQILMLFKRSVDNHQKYIEASCQWRYILKLPNASQAAIDYKLCELALIEQFTQVLKKPL